MVGISLKDVNKFTNYAHPTGLSRPWNYLQELSLHGRTKKIPEDNSRVGIGLSKNLNFQTFSIFFKNTQNCQNCTKTVQIVQIVQR